MKGERKEERQRRGRKREGEGREGGRERDIFFEIDVLQCLDACVYLFVRFLIKYTFNLIWI